MLKRKINGTQQLISCTYTSLSLSDIDDTGRRFVQSSQTSVFPGFGRRLDDGGGGLCKSDYTRLVLRLKRR